MLHNHDNHHNHDDHHNHDNDYNEPIIHATQVGAVGRWHGCERSRGLPTYMTTIVRQHWQAFTAMVVIVVMVVTQSAL